MYVYLAGAVNVGGESTFSGNTARVQAGEFAGCPSSRRYPPAKERETDTHVRPTPTHSIQKFTNVEDFRIGWTHKMPPSETPESAIETMAANTAFGRGKPGDGNV